MPQAIAELLGVPAVTFAKSVSFEGETLTVKRQTETGTETVEAQLPCVLSVTAGVNEPRYPQLRLIMAAKSKPLERLSLADLSLDSLGGETAGAVGGGRGAGAGAPGGRGLPRRR